MNIERIKNDLAIRVQTLMASRKETILELSEKTWKDKIADTEVLVKKIYDTLYEVLQTNGIQLSNNNELEGLISVLEPSVNDLIIKNMDD